MRTLASAQIADILDEVNYRGQVMTADVGPLGPGMRTVGRARTVQFAPSEDVGDNPYDDMIDFIDSIERDEVVVIATGCNPATAYWGELFSAAAKGRGAAGVICDSFTRDRSKVLALDFPVFCAGTRPVDYRARMRVVDTQHTVMCAGVRISPGDLVVADDDGIVAVPASIIDDVLPRAESRLRTEGSVLTDLVNGVPLRAVWQRYRVL
ncbi:RraA family protein [Streptomyces tubercidicus]